MAISMGKIRSLCMQRQHLTAPANEQEYHALYRDLQPGQNVYWNGFGDPPSLSFRVCFDDKALNRARQNEQALIKGRFAGGNIGWIMREDIELFAALYQKPLKNVTEAQQQVLSLIRSQGPMNIQQIKEQSGLLVKQITPALHRLQEAFLVYEDQRDGEWDRGWLPFEAAFPQADLNRYTRPEALRMVLMRFAYRMVWFDTAMAHSFYRLPEKEIRAALDGLTREGMLTAEQDGYLRAGDAAMLEQYEPEPCRFVYAIHRNDFLYKAQEHLLKERFSALCGDLPYDHDALQYLLVDGEFAGVVVGHFRNGPYDLNDVVMDMPQAQQRREEILAAVRQANYGKSPERFMGKRL